MAKERDRNPGGRMLFTDFDASEKGRPVAEILSPTVQEPASPDFFRRPIPSLEDLALSLDLDFEDDEGTETPPSAPPAPFDFSRPAAPPDPLAFSRPSAASVIAPDPGPSPSAISQVPTWEEFTAAFSRRDPAASHWLPVSEKASPLRHDAAGGETSGKFAGEKVPDDDAFGPDFDILSALTPPGTDADAAPPGAWRGGRLGMEPPRAVPYGGIERVDEWYRPPEAPVDGGIEEKAAPEMPAAVLRETGREESAKKPASETSLYLGAFDGIDLDALWQERVRQSRNAQRGGRGDTIRAGSSDLFADLDLEAAWIERKRRASREGKIREAGKTDLALPHPEESGRGGVESAAADKSDTVIMDSFAADKSETVIMDSSSLDLHAEETPRPAARPEPSTAALPPGGAPPAAPGAEGPPRFMASGAAVSPGPETLDFLEDAEESPPPTAKRRGKEGGSKKKEPPASLEDLDIKDLIDVADAGGESGAVAEAGAGPIADAPGGMTADALLASMDLEADFPAINSNVRAPVLGDIAIVHPEQRTGKLADVPGEALPPSPEAELDGHLAEAPEAGDSSDAVLADEDADSAISSLLNKLADGEGEAPDDESGAAVNPMDVFANLDDMDFSGDDGLDDEMRAMLDDGADKPEEPEAGGADSATDPDVLAAAPPAGWRGKILSRLRGLPGSERIASLLARLPGLIAWRENWWFYCDLLAAVIASASLAVILSYLLWYR